MTSFECVPALYFPQLGESRDPSWIILDLLIHSASVDTDVPLLYGLKMTQISPNLSVALLKRVNRTTRLHSAQAQSQYHVLFITCECGWVGSPLMGNMDAACFSQALATKQRHTHTHTTLTYTQKGFHMALNGENKTKELNEPRNRTTMET